MEILIKTKSRTRELDGETFTLDANPNNTVDDIKEIIFDREGTLVKWQQLTFSGKILESGRTLSSYGIHHNATLYMEIVLLGMISNFSEYDRRDPLIEFLMKGDVDGVEISEELLKKKMRGFYGYSVKSTLKFEHTGNDIFGYDEKRKLTGVADYVFSLQQIQGKSNAMRQDIKILLPIGSIQKITGSNTAEKVLRLKHPESQCLRSSHPTSHLKLVLRRTGPTKGCLPWHIDGLYSTATVQYTLNDDTEYKGGRLCFYTGDLGLHIPRRPAGTLSIHTKELHGVSRLMSGVRYVLFVVEPPNDLGGPKENIVDMAENDMLQNMLATMNNL